jgi:hypothetical protein
MAIPHDWKQSVEIMREAPLIGQALAITAAFARLAEQRPAPTCTTRSTVGVQPVCGIAALIAMWAAHRGCFFMAAGADRASVVVENNALMFTRNRSISRPAAHVCLASAWPEEW